MAKRQPNFKQGGTSGNSGKSDKQWQSLLDKKPDRKILRLFHESEPADKESLGGSTR